MICFISLLYLAITNCLSKEVDPVICDKLTILGSLSLIEFFLEFVLYTTIIHG